MHLSCYLFINEKTTLRDALTALASDARTQLDHRLTVLDEEAQNNSTISFSYLIVAMVNPFDLNTDNMTRISPFNLLFPRKVTFTLPLFHGGIKTKLDFNDYLLFYETNAEA